jgi:hypothetical protein
MTTPGIDWIGSIRYETPKFRSHPHRTLLRVTPPKPPLPNTVVPPPFADAACCVSDKESRSTWGRLIAQLYEVHSLTCIRCGSPMRILALITEPEELRKILRHLVKIGRSPPGFDPALLNLQSCKIRGREKEIAVAMRKSLVDVVAY